MYCKYLVYKISFRSISEHRQSLMGIAIMLIMFCHNILYFDNSTLTAANNVMKSFCTIGVDIFLLLSGLGCYYSLTKRRDFLDFYKKRILRILPLYFLIIVPWVYILAKVEKQVFWELFHEYSLHAFLLDGIVVEWYIPAILFLYLLAPFLYMIIKKNKFLYRFIIGGIIITSFLISVLSGENTVLRTVNSFFISRVPVYMFGMQIGVNVVALEEAIIKDTRYCNKRETANSLTKILLLIMCLLFVINYYVNTVNYLVVSHLFIFIPLILLICFHIECNVVSGYDGILSFWGKYTLEIYLIHDKVYYLANFFIDLIYPDKSFIVSMIGNIISIAVTLVLAVVIGNSFNAFLSMIYKKCSQKGSL